MSTAARPLINIKDRYVPLNAEEFRRYENAGSMPKKLSRAERKKAKLKAQKSRSEIDAFLFIHDIPFIRVDQAGRFRAEAFKSYLLMIANIKRGEIRRRLTARIVAVILILTFFFFIIYFTFSRKGFTLGSASVGAASFSGLYMLARIPVTRIKRLSEEATLALRHLSEGRDPKGWKTYTWETWVATPTTNPDPGIPSRVQNLINKLDRHRPSNYELKIHNLGGHYLLTLTDGCDQRTLDLWCSGTR